MKKYIISPSYGQEEINKMRLERTLKSLLHDTRIPDNPTRIFKVGEHVSIGYLENACIIEDYNNEHKIYKVSYYSYHDAKKQEKSYEESYWEWTSIFPLVQSDLIERITIPKAFDLHYLQGNIASLLFKVYNQNVNFNAEYQRDYVWTIEDKLYLIDSVMNNIDIGKFIFVKLDYEEFERTGYELEILDGKQRLSTLCEFYEGRFKYNNKLFSELHPSDRRYFKDHNVTYSEVEHVSLNDRIKLFIKVNTAGKVMDKEHLDKMKKYII